MNKRFWMVWSPQGRAPTRPHFSEEEALQEASRLVNLPHSDGPFFVLEAQHRLEIERRPVKTTKLLDEPYTEIERSEYESGDGIPF